MSVTDGANALACIGTRLLLGDLGAVTGPFFLGFMMEAFGMGVVLVLASDYLLSVASRRKLSSESPRRLGVCLVSMTLAVTLAQTIIDLYRGFTMFGNNFMNIGKFLTPDPLWFWSPCLGILSAVIAQCFLLRRIVRFLSSLELLWPILSKKAARYAFTAGMLVAIFMSAVAGNMATGVVVRSRGLASVGLGGARSQPFQILSGVWLGTAVAVDAVLCAVLCVELWWARRKLSMKGTTMQEFMTRLILVTFHGGAAVTGLQVATLLLYYYQRASSWCYFPMILLPKVYSITLVLSISLPQQNTAKAPDQMLSLLTIPIDPADTQLSPSPPGPYPIPLAGEFPHFTATADRAGENRIGRKEDQGAAWTQSAPDLGEKWYRTNWKRKSQGLLSWSVMPGAMEKEGEDQGDRSRVMKGIKISTQAPRPASAPQTRRPSLMPLLWSTPSPPSARRLLAGRTSPPSSAEFTRSTTIPRPFQRDGADPSSFSTSSTLTPTLFARRDSHPIPLSDLYPQTPISYPLATYIPPSPATASSSTYRQSSSFSLTSPPSSRPWRRSTVPSLPLPDLGNPYVLPLPMISPGPELDPGPGTMAMAEMGFHFDTINPFGSIYSTGTSHVSLARYPACASGSQGPVGMHGSSSTLSGGVGGVGGGGEMGGGVDGGGTRSAELPLETRREGEEGGARPGYRRSRTLPVPGPGVEDELDLSDEEEYDLRRMERGRNMSFQDFLAGGPDSPPEGKGKGEKRGPGMKRDGR